ncbi:unnamed protein product [Urochloa humidicola]
MALAASQPELPDEVTENILLRLDGAADVVRAAVASQSHLRVVRDRRFLLQFQSLRPPPLVGLLSSTGKLHHAEPPHSSAPVVRGVARDGDFAFSFLPSRGIDFTDWSVCDTRGGRVLLYRSRLGNPESAAFLDLAVADPLHRRHVIIPPIPDEIVLKRYSAEMRSEPFLAAALEGEDEEEAQCQFQVIYNWMSNYKIDTFVFSSGTGKWRAATSFSFLPHRLIANPKVLVRYYAGGCFCWVHFRCKCMLVLDQRETNFSIVGLPTFYDFQRVQGLAVFGTGGMNMFFVRIPTRWRSIVGTTTMVVGQSSGMTDRSSLCLSLDVATASLVQLKASWYLKGECIWKEHGISHWTSKRFRLRGCA